VFPVERVRLWRTPVECRSCDICFSLFLCSSETSLRRRLCWEYVMSPWWICCRCSLTSSSLFRSEVSAIISRDRVWFKGSSSSW
jgi:hypothetical protein